MDDLTPGVYLGDTDIRLRPGASEERLIDPDCAGGKCGSCVGGPCEHDCHGTIRKVSIEEALDISQEILIETELERRESNG